ncbi:MAG: hypothetical protein IPJ37_08745 [Bacteroidales bacterium]|nr:hypothetical protein [Bacteroidales bacterium]
MNIKYQILRICFLLSIVFLGCNTRKIDEFAIFETAEVLDTISKSISMIPVTDRIFTIKSNLPLAEKIRILLDTISKSNFNNLKFEILRIDKTKDGGKLLKINLKEPQDFKIPEDLGKFHTWYDFFQGSYGGEQTTIILIESILQRQFTGDWIDELEFYYQNEPIGEWDHIYLSDTIKRK